MDNEDEELYLKGIVKIPTTHLIRINRKIYKSSKVRKGFTLFLKLAKHLSGYFKEDTQMSKGLMFFINSH